MMSVDQTAKGYTPCGDITMVTSPLISPA